MACRYVHLEMPVPDRGREPDALAPTEGTGSRARFWGRLGTAALVPAALVAVWEQVQIFTILTGRPWADAIDYKLYRVAAAIGVHSGWSHIYDANLQRPAIVPFWPRIAWPAWWQSSQAFWTPMVTPPPAAWLAAPFGALPLEVASRLWMALLTVALVATVLVIAPPGLASKLRYAAVIALTWASVVALVSGNLVVLVALALAVGWRLLEDRREVLAGVVLGLTTIKPQVVFVVPVLLLVTGRWRAVTAWAAVAAVLAVASLLMLGAHGVVAYRDLVGLVSGFTGQQKLGLAQLPLPALERAILPAAALALFAIVAWHTRERGPAVTLALGIMASLLVSPYLNAEDFVLLLPAGLLLVRARRSPWEAVPAIAMILSATPASQSIVWPAYVAMAATLAAVVLPWRVQVAVAQAA